MTSIAEDQQSSNSHTTERATRPPRPIAGALPRSAPIDSQQRPPRPQTPYNPNIADVLPPELTERPQWVVWLAKWEAGKDGKPGRWSKLPYNAATGQLADSTNPDTWSSLETAMQAWKTGKYNGIGFVLSPDDPFTGIDLDKCYIPEKEHVYPDAMATVMHLDSYTEISPSGTGIRIILKGTPPGDRCRTGNTEVYFDERFLTITGNFLDAQYNHINERQDELSQWYVKVFPPEPAPQPRQAQPCTLSLNDSELLNLAYSHKNGNEIRALMSGGLCGWGSMSEGDGSLTCHLAFYTDDPDQIRRIWQSSARWRDKCDKRPDYINRTISSALAKVTNKYTKPSESNLTRLIVSGVNGSQNGASSTGNQETQPALISVPPVDVREALPMAEPSVIMACLSDEEYADAELLKHLYGDRLVYDHSEKTWYYWQGQHYAPDRTGLVVKLVAGQVASQYLLMAAKINRDAEAESNEDKRGNKKKLADSCIKRARSLRTLKRNNNVLKFAWSLMGISGDEWDKDPYLLGVSNGVIDLTTGNFRAGLPQDYIRTVCPTEWKGLYEPSPRWEQFINEISDGNCKPDKPGDKPEDRAKNQAERIRNQADLASFQKRVLGCGLIGKSAEDILLIFHGPGRNGKDTLLDTISNVLGPMAGPVMNDVLLGHGGGGGAQPHIYDLRGKRIVWASETNEAAKLNVGQVKWLTGRGKIKTRTLHARPVEFEQSHLLILSTNEMPKVPSETSDNYAIWKRILKMPFSTKFVDSPDAPDEKQRDPNLRERLSTEAPGILAYLVRGCLEYQRDGLNPPPIVRMATREYQNAEDNISGFIEECCIIEDGKLCSSSALFDAYLMYAEIPRSSNLDSLRVNFGKRLGKMFAKKRQTGGYWYLGIDLKPPSDQDELINPTEEGEKA